MAAIGQTGRSFKMAFAKHGTNSWGVAASVTMGVHFESDGAMQLKPAMITDQAFNQAFLSTAQPGLVESPSLSLPGSERYEDYQFVLEALAMGSPAAVAISTSASGQTTSWTHQFDLATAIDGLGATFAIDKNLYVDELTSSKINGFELVQDDRGRMVKTYSVIGSKPTNISSVNINSTVAGASYPALGNRALQQEGVFRMNLHSAGAVGASDAIEAESIRFRFNRPQDAPHVFGQDYVTEPADNGHPEFLIEITRPRMNTPAANSMYAAVRSGVAFKADWTFLGAFINSTDRFKILYQYPYLQPMDDGFLAATTGAQQIKPVLKLRPALAPTSPTGMAFVNPFRLTRIMTNSTVAF